MNDNLHKLERFNYRDLMIFLTPLLIFVLYLFVYNPGILTAASFSQLHQIATSSFTNAYPILHTFIEKLFLKLSGSPISIGILQIFVFCVIWMIICKYHRDDTSESSDMFVMQFAVTLIICLIPINAVYSVTLSSNILFSYALLFLCFLIKVMIDKNGLIDAKLAILIALTLAAVSGLSTYGLYIALILLILILGYLFKKGSSKNTLIKLSIIALACIFLIASLNVICNVGQDDGNFPVNDAFEDGVNLENARSQFFSTIQGGPVRGFENANSVNIQNSNFDMVNSYVDLFRQNIILDSLFNNPVLYVIFSIVLLGFIYFITKSEEIFFVLIPNILNMIFVLVTGINNLYSNLLVFYLIVIILVSLWFKSDLKPKDIKSMTTPRKEKNDYSDIESEIDNLTLDEINALLGETATEPELDIDQMSLDEIDEVLENQTEPEQINVIKEDSSDEMSSDLVDEILKEIEMNRK